MKTIDTLKSIQNLLRRKFRNPQSAFRNSSCGECTISISPDKIDMTDQDCHIVARGPAHVATVIRRKKRKP